MADIYIYKDFLRIISCQSVAVLIVLIIRAYCEFPETSSSSDLRGPREQRPQCWRAPQVLIEIIWGWSCDLEHLKYLSIYCGERYSNNTCLPGLISAPNHKGSYRRPWITVNSMTSKVLHVHLCCSPTPFAVVSHKRVWNDSIWECFSSLLSVHCWSCNWLYAPFPISLTQLMWALSGG